MNRPFFALSGIVLFSAFVLATSISVSFDATLSKNPYQVESLALVQLVEEGKQPELANIELTLLNYGLKKTPPEGRKIKLTDKTEPSAKQAVIIVRVKQGKTISAYSAIKSPDSDISISFPTDFSYVQTKDAKFYLSSEIPNEALETQSKRSVKIGWAYTYGSSPKILIKAEPIIYDSQAYQIIDGKQEKPYNAELNTPESRIKIVKDKLKELSVFPSRVINANFPAGTAKNVFYRSEKPPGVVVPGAYDQIDGKTVLRAPFWDGRDSDGKFLLGEFDISLDSYQSRGTGFSAGKETTDFGKVRVFSRVVSTGQFKVKGGETIKAGDFTYNILGIKKTGGQDIVELRIFDSDEKEVFVKDEIKGELLRTAYKTDGIYQDTTLLKGKTRVVKESGKYLGRFMFSNVEESGNEITAIFTVSQPFLKDGQPPITVPQPSKEPSKPKPPQTPQRVQSAYNGGLYVEECKEKEGQACYSYRLDGTYELTEIVDKIDDKGRLYPEYTRAIGRKSGTYDGVTKPLPKGVYFVILEGRSSGNTYFQANGYARIQNEYLRKAFLAAAEEQKKLDAYLTGLVSRANVQGNRFTKRPELDKAVSLNRDLLQLVNPSTKNQRALDLANSKLDQLRNTLDSLEKTVAKLESKPPTAVPGPVIAPGVSGEYCYGDGRIVSSEVLIGASGEKDTNQWISRKVIYSQGTCVTTTECGKQKGTQVADVKQACPTGTAKICCTLGSRREIIEENPAKASLPTYQLCRGLTTRNDCGNQAGKCIWKSIAEAKCEVLGGVSDTIQNDADYIRQNEVGQGESWAVTSGQRNNHCAQGKASQEACLAPFQYPILTAGNTHSFRGIVACAYTPEMGKCEEFPWTE